MRKAVSRVRLFYINAKGELFLQFYPEKVHELSNLCVGYNACESLQSGYQAEGEISRITKTGVSIRNWRLI